MRHLRLVLPALAFVVAGTWATQIMACDKHKGAVTTAATATHSAACTAEMAAACTPEMAAACRAKGAKAGATTAATARAGKPTAAVASSEHCTGGGAKAIAVLAGTGEGCGAKGARTSGMAVSGPQCSGHGMANVAAKIGHGDCDACADMATCYEELEAAGVRTQVVPLKNGVMYVYTAEQAGKGNVVQSAMARRSERLTQIVNAGDRAKLCAECKSIRGAVASGKLSREVVNIEGGALTLMTSNDPALVAKLHAMVVHSKSGRTKT